MRAALEARQDDPPLRREAKGCPFDPERLRRGSLQGEIAQFRHPIALVSHDQTPMSVGEVCNGVPVSPGAIALEKRPHCLDANARVLRVILVKDLGEHVLVCPHSRATFPPPTEECLLRPRRRGYGARLLADVQRPNRKSAQKTLPSAKYRATGSMFRGSGSSGARPSRKPE